MPDYMSLVLFATVFALLLVGFPVAFTLGGVSLIFGYFTFGLNFFQLLPLRIWGTMTNYVLIAVPLFVYMGLMLENRAWLKNCLKRWPCCSASCAEAWQYRSLLSVPYSPHRQVLSAPRSSPWDCCHYRRWSNAVIRRSCRPEQSVLPAPWARLFRPALFLSCSGASSIFPSAICCRAIIPGLVLVGLYILWIVIVATFRPEAAPAMPAEELAVFRSQGCTEESCALSCCLSS